ncbi:hypothetical protein O1611_g5285 [Lasiodiplodia mahajangana]|uniref:Uncharacterized protein n=1 Tax=Lasiodiplodia mahajangana TaxID=1108764 RepID=A0ACC2JLW7_9PEZI|nr:hypothetical protein O1611_g5285 [Lasiodiplodia mahajangana]
MSPVLRLVARIAEDAQRSYGAHNAGEENLKAYNNRDDGDADDGHNSGLPWWGILIIVYTSIISVVFLSAFAYYWRRVWKATSVATGLWIWSWVFQSRGWCGSDRKRDGSARPGAGPYHHIEARRNLGTRGSASTAPSSTSTRTTRPNTPAQHGAPANQKSAYTPNGQSKATLKSSGSKLSHDTFDHHESIPMGLLSPNRNPIHTPPPPYISSPPPVELDGQAIEPPRNNRMY